MELFSISTFPPQKIVGGYFFFILFFFGGVRVTSTPVEAVHHLQVHPQVFLGEVVQHARVHQALHEVAAVLR